MFSFFFKLLFTEFILFYVLFILLFNKTVYFFNVSLRKTFWMAISTLINIFVLRKSRFLWSPVNFSRNITYNVCLYYILASSPCFNFCRKTLYRESRKC